MNVIMNVKHYALYWWNNLKLAWSSLSKLKNPINKHARLLNRKCFFFLPLRYSIHIYPFAVKRVTIRC